MSSGKFKRRLGHGAAVHAQSTKRLIVAGTLTLLAVGTGLRSFWPDKPGAPTRRAHKIIRALRALPSSPLQPQVEAEPPSADIPGRDILRSPTQAAVRVTLPAYSTEPLHVEDAKTGFSVDVQMRDVFKVVAQSADGYFVYPHAHATGGTLLHREIEDGAEDYVSFETKPAKPEVAYDVDVKRVHAVRLVEGVVEFLDDSGTPRLRATPPFIVGADGERTDAAVAIENCTVDTDPAPPWGRDVTAPGTDSCRLRVRWDDERVKYPAVLDPRWVSTSNMTSARQDFTGTMMSTGKVLAVGGRTSGTSTTGLATAEVFDPATRTWATTASLAGGRYLQMAVQLGSTSSTTTNGKVLVAGGTNAGTSLNTAQLYAPSTGTWVAAANLNASRHGATATLLSNGNVLLAGGLSAATVLNTAAVFNPSSGAGTFTATSTMPQAVKFHTATRLQVPGNSTLNDKVLVVGGNSGTGSVTNVQLFDANSTWSSLTALSSAREGHTATALANGNVLIAGGRSGSTTLNTTLLFNAASGSGSFASAGNLTTARQLHTATLLPSANVEPGTVLVAGGSSGSASQSSTEVWNGTSTWTASTALPGGVQGQTATLLNNNLVLLAGGANGSTTVATSVTFDGSFALQCTANSQCGTGFCVNGVCCDTACNNGCGVCNLPGKVGTCSAASSGTVCRAQNGACDVAETCNGTSLACPADAVSPLGSVCRNSAGACDVPEVCDGATKACPADGFAPPTQVCRASTGSCDAAETCTGTSAACPNDAFAPSTTVCRPATGPCDVAETCPGTSALCPPDTLSPAGTICRAAVSLCDVAETCSGSSNACPGDTFASAGTVCGAAIGGAATPVCNGSNDLCPESSTTTDVLGFEVAADWTVDQSSTTASIVGTNTTHSQGTNALEVAAQNFSRFNSAPVGSLGMVGSTFLVDVMLPTSQPNPSWYGDFQMYLNSPSLGLNNVFLAAVPMTGLPLGVWDTIAVPIPGATASTLAHSTYSDLSVSVVLNVPYNVTGHYLLDNIRSVPDVVPALIGIAQNSKGVTKAVFTYVTSASSVTIPYGAGNGLADQNGFVQTPMETPPTTFVSATHAPFVATLANTLLTWTVDGHSATATPSSAKLPTQAVGDGTLDAILPGGQKVNLDAVPPANPAAAQAPPVGAPFNGVLTGQFSVTPAGAATYTVPITIPPGIAGMAPNLALTYSSQGNDGIAGQGWGLSGLSLISRCPRTRQQDGYARPVMLDSLTPSDNQDGLSDGICLDGKKLLDAGSGSYVSEQTDFSQITLDATGAFQVLTKAGETRYYGLSTNNRVGGANTAMWLLDRVVDAWGNYFDVHYNADVGNGLLPDLSTNFTNSGISVSEIDYTGSLGNSAPDSPAHSTPTAPFTSVTFQYECRPDIRWTRLASLKIPQSQRLKSITTAQGTYSLTYTQGVEQTQGPACPVGDGPSSLTVSQVQSIGYCAGATCLDPLTFQWLSDSTSGWQPNTGYALPSTVVAPGKGLKGTQFVDVNGDGRLDLVVGRTNGVGGKPQLTTLLNTGSGWGPPLTGAGQTFPLYLSDGSDKPTQVRFADFDGDGRTDVIVDKANVSCDANGCVSCPVNMGCPGQQPYGPAVWLNNFTVDGGGGWKLDKTYSGTSMTFGDATMMGDVDGDQKADIIQVLETAGNPTTLSVQVISNATAQGVHSWPSRVETYTVPFLNGGFRAVDVNRDGLADLVQEAFFLYADGSVSASELDLINLGPGHPDPQHTFRAVFHAAPAGGSAIDPSISLPHYGDIDGDGFHDVAEFAPLSRGTVTYLAAVGFGNGSGSGFGSDPNQQKYLNVLNAYAPPVCQNFLGGCAAPEDYGFALADINGDGLVDLIRNHVNRGSGAIQSNQGGGEILMNSGQTWISIAGTTAWQAGAGSGRIPAVVPSEATADAGSAFLDLDGDGITDVVQEDLDAGLTPGAWISPYRRPAIKTFPNGLARPTTVNYVSTTSGSSTYKDDDTTEANTKPFPIPVTVVSTVTAEDGSGTGTQATRTYTYHSMRQDSFGRGPLGFHRVEVLDQASSVRTVTTYFQAYPYTGMPAEVDKYQVVGSQSHLPSQTSTLYCDTADTNPSPPLGCGPVPVGPFPAGVKVFTFPSTVSDVAYLHPETDDLANKTTILTTFHYDGLGNATDTTTHMAKTEGGATETFQKQVQNFYETAEAAQEGKPTRTVTSATGGTGSTTHTTTFEYSPVNSFGGASSRLALTKKRTEPGAGWPIEIDMAYAYDPFGNALTTTTCASDFGSCAAGAANPSATGATDPADPSDPVHHPPFRTTTVSYNPADLGVPASYGVGRFPSKTTNALGQSEKTLYDPVLGKVLVKTGPNGIQSCYAYDGLGRPTIETERCGSTTPLVTTTQYFRTLARSAFCPDPGCTPPPTGFSPPNSVIVTVTTPPTGAVSWSYSDDQGKSTGTLAYAFDGGFIETTAAYNPLGQVTQTAKPFHLATLADQVTPAYTSTTYDSFNRVFTVTDPLGVIDGSGVARSTTITTTYNGSTVKSDRVVNGQTQTRFETKNTIGKVAAVSTQTETGLTTISYFYDADGNLTLTTDPAGNQVQIGYDTRGRKQSTIDPDMGSWGYTSDGFGDLVSQTDAKGQSVTMLYDRLGRMLSKTDATGTAMWLYDTAPGAGIGKLAAMVGAPDSNLLGSCAIPSGITATGGQRAVKSYQYTAFGDLQEADECADGTTFATSYQYDALGRQSLIRYPIVGNSQLAVGYHYTTVGFLQYLTDESSDYSVLWQAKGMNALGEVTDEQMRNGVETVSTRNPLTGWLLGSMSTSHADHDNLIQDWSYGFDEIGNLLTRNRGDAVVPVSSSETFTYDLTNRLTTSHLTTSAGYSHQELYAYDPLGNLTQKAGSTYTYGAGCQAGGRTAGPHAVCTVAAGAPFTYDGDGNLTMSGTRSLTYNPSNKVTHVESDPAVSQGNDSGSVNFMYGADGNRVVQSVTSGGITTRTIYVGLGGTGRSLFEQTTAGTNVQDVHFIYAGAAHGGAPFALRVLDSSGMSNKYYSFDHLGFVTAMSDDQGHVSVSGTDPTVLGYGAWGARRNPDGTAANPASFNLPVGDREFTGQEQIPDVGLVNLNGRVYDPSLGRFLSPDPNVQFTADLQSYNRYSYAGNNPLRYSDPTGYFWSELGNFFSSTFSNPMMDFQLALSLAACVGTGGAGCIAVGLMFAGFNAFVAIANGAGFDQTILNTAIGLGVGLATGGLGQSLGANAWVSLLVGSASAALTTGISNVLSGQSFFQYNVLGSALLSAAQGALTLGLQKLAPVSQAGADQAQERAIRPRPALQTTMADAIGGAASDGTPLSADQATLDAHTAETNLAGRAVIDPSLAGTGIAGRTDGLTGIVHISPDAFADEGVLQSVIFHEGVHVDQLSSDNWAWLQSSPAHLVNEVEAYRGSIDYALANYNPAMSDYVVSNINQLLSDIDQLGATMGANGATYYQNVIAAQPNYTLMGSDVCSQCARP